MVVQNYQNLIEMTSNIFTIIAFGVGFKCPRKIHLNTQCPPPPDFQTFLRPCTACVWVCSSKFANRDDGQDGSLHDFVIEFDMFHMHVKLIILSTLLYTKSLYISRSV